MKTIRIRLNVLTQLLIKKTLVHTFALERKRLKYHFHHTPSHEGIHVFHGREKKTRESF